MKQVYFRVLEFLKFLQSKIAFYPSLFAILGLFLAVLLIFLDKQRLTWEIQENLPFLSIESSDTARSILSACITGLIAMMTFSFSLVMLLLSQASSNYSPRLLPGLISDKRHQTILGIFLGTILFCIIVLFRIKSEKASDQIPHFSLLIAIVLTMLCIYAFIYFIHSISQSIQISNILKGIFKNAEKTILKEIEREKGEMPYIPSTETWYEYKAETGGYLQKISYSSLLDTCNKKDNRIHILPAQGMFVLQGIPVFRSQKKLEKKDINNVFAAFVFGREELIEDNYVLAFKQITEVVVKAMSPGINDPGTALTGIDYLSELFALRLKLKDEWVVGKDGKGYIKVPVIKFEDLLYQIMASIRVYCKRDVTLVQKLLIMLSYLKQQPSENEEYHKCIDDEARNLLSDMKKTISNDQDFERALEIAQRSGLNVEKEQFSRKG